MASRLRGDFRRQVELSADGRTYKLLSEPVEPESFDTGWPMLKFVLEDSSSRSPRDGILQSLADGRRTTTN